MNKKNRQIAAILSRKQLKKIDKNTKDIFIKINKEDLKWVK